MQKLSQRKEVVMFNVGDRVRVVKALLADCVPSVYEDEGFYGAYFIGDVGVVVNIDGINEMSAPRVIVTFEDTDDDRASRGRSHYNVRLEELELYIIHESDRLFL